MVRSYTDKELLDFVKKLKSYKDIPKGYWILGVRGKQDIFNQYDDKLYVFQGEKFIDVMSGTTNAGQEALKNFDKYDTIGAGIIKANEWYYDTWERGLHKGKMPAWRQVRGILIIRDNNKNDKAGDLGLASWEYNKGFNFHTDTYEPQNKILAKAYKYVKSKFIGLWSFGCLVANDRVKYYEFMEYSKPQNRLTICLIDEF